MHLEQVSVFVISLRATGADAACWLPVVLLLLLPPVQLSFCGLVYPCLVVTYMGQASYLIANPDAYTGGHEPCVTQQPHHISALQ